MNNQASGRRPSARTRLLTAAAECFYDQGVNATGIDTIIVHLHGRSSTGKTFRLQAAASLWGKPLDPQTAGNDVTLIERWRTVRILGGGKK